jgi:hypothetical protein
MAKINLTTNESTRGDLKAKFVEIYFKSRDLINAERNCYIQQAVEGEDGMLSMTSTLDSEKLAEYITLLKASSAEISALAAEISATLEKCQ